MERGDDTAIELESLGSTRPDSSDHSKAYTINDAGTAVGWAEKYVSGNNLGNRAVLWDSTGQVIELGTLGTYPRNGWAPTVRFPPLARKGRRDPDSPAPPTASVFGWPVITSYGCPVLPKSLL